MDSGWVSAIVEASQVRVCSATGEVVGAGFLVAADVVCTCAHVVARALGVLATAEQALGQQVDLDFPLLGGRPRVRTTVVSWRFGGMDVALLRLDARVRDARPVPLVDRTAVRGNAFKALGYPAGADHGVWAWGTLRGQGLGWVQMETQEPGPHILEGFSGAPVWDGGQDGVVGMMVAAKLGESTAYLLPSDALVADEVILKPRCPFKGLSAFTEDDAEFFHGRDSDTERVHAAVRRRPVTVVAGPSGCGKSSLVQAGVLPRLRAEGMSASELRPPPGVPAAAVLARALTEILKPELGEVEWLAMAERLAGLPLEIGHDLAAELRARVLACGGSAGHVVFIDQLEEYEPWAARDLFGMLAALAGKDGTAALRVVATARPDFLDVLVTAGTSDLVSEAVCFLAPLGGGDLMRAVTGPVDAVPGLWFEPGLQDRIIADVSEEPGRMPLVQFALTELWMRRTRSTLTHAAYADMGGVAGAIVAYADGTLQGLTQAQRDCAPRLFVQLARPGDGDTFSRRSTRAADLAPELLDLARKLATRKLVVLSHGADGEEIVDLPHEALIQQWPRLRQWLVDCRDFRVWQFQLQEDLIRWRAHRESARLLSGSDLAEASRRLAEHPEDISADERSYILLSRRRLRWRGRAVQAASAARGRVAMLMRQGRDSEGRRHWQVLAVVGLWIAVLLAAASVSVREVLESFRLHAQLGPSDTPAVVTAIVALGTATGTLIGVTLTAYAKYVQARGQAEADLIRARAEMMRAEADVTRARAGLPPHDPSANGDSPAFTSPAEPDASQPPPSGGVT